MDRNETGIRHAQMKRKLLQFRREHHRSRRIEGTHPDRISLMWNVETPIGSFLTESRLTARKAELPSGNRKDQEANAGSRKTRGTHNPPDRADAQPERVLT
jgi:hypothetical protein